MLVSLGQGWGCLPALAPLAKGLTSCPSGEKSGKGSRGWLRDPTNTPDPEISLQQCPTVALQWEMVNNSQVRAETSRFLIIFFSEQLSRELNWVKRDHLYYF